MGVESRRLVVAKRVTTKKAAGQAKTVAARKPVAKKAAPATTSAAAAKKIDALIAKVKDWRGERLAEIRALIHEADPAVVEDWKWMGTPVWSNNGMYVLANPHKDKVKLQFFHGAKLADPKKLFNTGFAGNTWRAIDFFEGDAIDAPALKALLREAIDYNAKNVVAKSKGSRTKLMAR